MVELRASGPGMVGLVGVLPELGEDFLVLIGPEGHVDTITEPIEPVIAEEDAVGFVLVPSAIIIDRVMEAVK